MGHDIQNDITIVGGGIMGLTMATIVSEIYPKQKILLVERLNKCGMESSKGINNAGTGHAGYCELNYTPLNDKNEIEVHRAIKINEMFETSLQFWAYLGDKYKIFDIKKFLNKSPHISFVLGKKNVKLLKKRYQKLNKEPLFQDMQYTEEHHLLSKWAPLLMKGRSNDEVIAATRIEHGTDINFGELCNQLLTILRKNKNFSLKVNSDIFKIEKLKGESYELKYKIHNQNKINTIKSKKVFIGAGGMAISLTSEYRD